MIVRSKLPLKVPPSHCAHSTFSILATTPTLASCAATTSPPLRAYCGGGSVSVTFSGVCTPASFSSAFGLLGVVRGTRP